MFILDFSQYSKLFAYGDIHGEFKYLLNNIKSNTTINIEGKPRLMKKNSTWDGMNNSVVIVAGDIGFGFNKMSYYEQELSKLNDISHKNNIQIVFVRGNHDDPSFFTEDKFKMSNIHLVDDYTVVITEKHKTLCVGGGISIDRSWRKSREEMMNKYTTSCIKKIYWENEPMIYNETLLKEFKDNNIEIDSVVTHIPPKIDGLYKKDNEILNWCEMDEKLLNDIETEDNTIKNLQEFLKNNFKIVFWCSGHLHMNQQFFLNDVLYLQLANDYYYKNMDDIIKCFKEPTFDSISMKLGSPYTMKYVMPSFKTVATIEDPFEFDDAEENKEEEVLDIARPNDAYETLEEALNNL